MLSQASQKWRTVRLADIAKVVTGKTPPTKEAKYWGGAFPFLTPSDIDDGVRYVEKVERSVTDSWEKKVPHYLIRKNSTCYVCIGSTVGKIALMHRDGFTNQQLNCLTPYSEKVDDFFLFYLLKNEKRQIKSIADARGAGKPIINKTDFEDLKFGVPDLPTQKQIADVLSAYDDLIENNNRRIKILEEIAQKIYTEWFVNFRFPGYEQAKFSKDGLPEGWVKMKLRDVLVIDRGVSYSGKNISLDETDTPLISLKSFMRRGGYRDDGIKFYTGKLKESQIANGGDLLIANTDLTQEGEIIGAPIMVPQKFDRVAFTHHVYALRPKKNLNISMHYLYYYMLLESYRGYVKGHANGTTVLGLARESIYDHSIIYPEADLVKEFAIQVTAIRSEMEKITEANFVSGKIRDLLIPQLVTGVRELK